MHDTRTRHDTKYDHPRQHPCVTQSHQIVAVSRLTSKAQKWPWLPSWAISSGPRPDSRIRRAGRARKYRRADPVRPASPARGLLPCCLCTNMWMTCAQRRQAPPGHTRRSLTAGRHVRYRPITAAGQLTVGRVGSIGVRPAWDAQRPPSPSSRCVACPWAGYRSCTALIPGSTGGIT